jgi:AcrR family transcriptional regulator
MALDLPIHSDTEADRPPRRPGRDAEVLQAAVKVFCEKGYSAASVQDVADEVGVLKGSLYHYMDSKEDLLMRVFDEAHAAAIESMAIVMGLDVTPLERLRLYFERHVRWYLDNVESALVFFHEWRFLTDERLLEVRARRHAYEAFVGDLIADCRAAGEVRGDADPKHVLFFLLGGVNAVPDWYQPRGGDSAALIASRYGDMVVGVLTGTGARADAPGPPGRAAKVTRRSPRGDAS